MYIANALFSFKVQGLHKERTQVIIAPNSEHILKCVCACNKIWNAEKTDYEPLDD